MEEAWGGTGAWRGVTDKEPRYGREEVGEAARRARGMREG